MGRRGVLFVLSLLLAPLALAQGSDVQALVDAAQEGGLVSIPAGAHAGAIRVAKTLALEGVDRQTRLSSSGATVTIAAPDVALRFVEVQGDVVVEAGQRARLGPGAFLGVLRVGEGAVLLLLNDPSIPVNRDVAPTGRLLHAMPASVLSEASVEGLTATLLDGSGATLARFGPVDGARLDVAVPRATDGLWFAFSAAGHDEQRVPAAQVAAGYTLSFPEPEPTAEAIDELEAAAVQESTSAPAATPPALSPAQAAVVVTATVGASAAAAGGIAVWRSERRLLKLLGLIAPLYTRLRKDKLLDAPLRERVHAHVVANPGVRYRELQRALAIPNGALAHHLQVLVREQLLREEREGHAVRFYAAGVASAQPVDTAARVLAFVAAHPGATGSDVARALDLTASLAGYHLQKLQESGAIRREREGGSVRAWPSDEA